jgi:sugar transferase (PEP-CTERM/EpsH1 system associated)
MRILFLTPQLPFPPDKGTRIRNFGLIKEIARRHEVGVVSFGDPDDRAAIDALARHCRVLAVVPPPRRTRVARALATFGDGVPDLARRLESPELTAHLRAALRAEPWDVLQVEALEMAPTWLATRDVAKPAVVLDSHNAEWVLQQRTADNDLAAGRAVGGLYSLLQARKLRRYEGRAIDLADATIAVSTEDAAALERVGRPRRLTVVPNGVDAAALSRRTAEAGGATILFTGTMDYRPNVDAVRWFVAEVWPLIRRERVDARFVIAGRDPSPAVRALSSVPGVEVTGAIPDVAPLFRDATLYVAPLRIGGGMRLKLLEAFAYGATVVSTRLGAEGIDLVHGRDAVLADEPGEMAAAVARLLANPSERLALADAARRLVESRYDWRALAPTVEQLYADVLVARGALAVA